MDELLFTPAAVLDLLSKIDELKDVDVGITETLDDRLQITVGDSIYEIEDDNATEIQIDPPAMDAVIDTNQQAYENLEESGEVDMLEPVESGILKEVAKTLLVGGLVRAGAKVLKGWYGMKKVITADISSTRSDNINKLITSIKSTLNIMNKCQSSDLASLDSYTRKQFWKAYDALVEIENNLS